MSAAAGGVLKAVANRLVDSAMLMAGQCTPHFSFGKTKRGPRRAPRGGESRSSEVSEFWLAWPERGMRSL